MFFDLKPGDQFKFLIDGEIYELERIIEYDLTNKAKKKLSEPLFSFKGINTPKNFINRLQDVKRAFMFKQWKKIN